MRFANKFCPTLLLFVVIVTVALAETPLFDVPRLTGVIVDGKTDDWGRRGLAVETMTSQNGEVRRLSDYDCRFRVGWN